MNQEIHRGCKKPSNMTKADLALNFSARRNAIRNKLLLSRKHEISSVDVASLHVRLATQRLNEGWVWIVALILSIVDHSIFNSEVKSASKVGLKTCKIILTHFLSNVITSCLSPLVS